ncbi:hypothetical protein Bhyg_15505 [Pseudolycoriella hygida]|uniref:Uncharacterized protein n=1 Tax=Pseudolycoriella hygida TaxID=35572 RepID=A0A9Q0MKY5_9DIPT|nr:hypothetical protein Bhyg_15505 [Pseudolycoriella hygida]
MYIYGVRSSYGRPKSEQPKFGRPNPEVQNTDEQKSLLPNTRLRRSNELFYERTAYSLYEMLNRILDMEMV